MAYANGRDRTREAERRAAEVQREKDGRALAAKIAELDRQIARVEGYRDAILSQALANEELRDAERMRLAARKGMVRGYWREDGVPVLELRDGHGITDADVDDAIRKSFGFSEQQ